MAGALTILAACAETAVRGGDYTAADAARQADLNECRTRAAVMVSPSAGGGTGLAGANTYDQAVAQCLRNIRKSRPPTL